MRTCGRCGGSVSRPVAYSIYACPCNSTSEVGPYSEIHQAQTDMDCLLARYLRTRDPEVKRQFDQAHDRWLGLVGVKR